MLVSPDDLNTEDPSLRLIHCGGLDTFPQAHICGAQPFVWDSMTKGDGGVHVWPAARMRGVAEQLGLGRDSRVVVYDSGSAMLAARVWWTLKYFGHGNCVVLDGGFPAYVRAGKRVCAGAPRAVQVQGAAFEPSPQLSMLTRSAELLRASQSTGSGRTILDVRSTGEFTGAEARGTARAGHVPGAAHVPFNEFLRPDGTYKSPDDIRARLEQAGVNPALPAITYCLGGMRAAVGVLALQLARVPHVTNYDAGMKEWLNSPSMPVGAASAQ